MAGPLFKNRLRPWVVSSVGDWYCRRWATRSTWLVGWTSRRVTARWSDAARCRVGSASPPTTASDAACANSTPPSTGSGNRSPARSLAAATAPRRGRSHASRRCDWPSTTSPSWWTLSTGQSPAKRHSYIKYCSCFFTSFKFYGENARLQCRFCFRFEYRLRIITVQRIKRNCFPVILPQLSTPL